MSDTPRPPETIVPTVRALGDATDAQGSDRATLDAVRAVFALDAKRP